MWKKIFFRQVSFSALLLSLATGFGCAEDIRSNKNKAILDNPEIKKVLSKYLDREVADKSFGKKPKQYAFCAYKVLGVEQRE